MSTFSFNNNSRQTISGERPFNIYIEEDNIDSGNRDPNCCKSNNYTVPIPSGELKSVIAAQMFSFQLLRTQSNLRAGQTLLMNEFYDLTSSLNTVSLGRFGGVILPSLLTPYAECFLNVNSNLEREQQQQQQQTSLDDVTTVALHQASWTLRTTSPHHFFNGLSITVQPHIANGQPLEAAVLQVISAYEVEIGFLPMASCQIPIHLLNAGGTVFIAPPRNPQQLVELTNQVIEQTEFDRRYSKGTLPRVSYDCQKCLYDFASPTECLTSRRFLISPNEFTTIYLPSQDLDVCTTTSLMNSLLNPFQVKPNQFLAISIAEGCTPNISQCMTPQLLPGNSGIADCSYIKIPLLPGEYNASGLAQMTCLQLAKYMPKGTLVTVTLDNLSHAASDCTCCHGSLCKQLGNNNNGDQHCCTVFCFQSDCIRFNLLWSKSSCPKELSQLYGFSSTIIDFFDQTRICSSVCVSRPCLQSYYDLSWSENNASSDPCCKTTTDDSKRQQWIIQQTSAKRIPVCKTSIRGNDILIETSVPHSFCCGNLVQLTLCEPTNKNNNNNNTVASGYYRVIAVHSFTSFSLGFFGRYKTSAQSLPVECGTLFVCGAFFGSFQLGFLTAQQTDIAQILGFCVPKLLSHSSIYRSIVLPSFRGVSYVLVDLQPLPGQLYHQLVRQQPGVRETKRFFAKLILERNGLRFELLRMSERPTQDQSVGQSVSLSNLNVAIYNPDGSLYDTKGVNHSFELRFFLLKTI